MTYFRAFFCLILVTALLLSCGAEQSSPQQVPPVAAKAVAAPNLPTPTFDDPAVATPTPIIEPTAVPAVAAPPANPHPLATNPNMVYLPIPYYGDATLEERIATADVIAHVRMLTVANAVERFEPEAAKGGTTTPPLYAGVLKFTFDVQEYLKSGTTTPDRITAIVGSLDRYGTTSEAQAVSMRMLAERDSQWDDRDAIVFLVSETTEFPGTASDGLYFMSVWDFTYGLGDAYSIASRRNKIWLPSITPSNAQAAGELRFMLALPTQGQSSTAARRSADTQTPSTAPTIGLSDLKTKIATVDAMTIDDSRKQQLCVALKLVAEREQAFRRSQGKSGEKYVPERAAAIKSGHPPGTVVFKETGESMVSEDWKSKSWIEGEGADLFAEGDVTKTIPAPFSLRNSSKAFGGKFFVQASRVIRPLVTVRPLPQGTYKLTWNKHGLLSAPCNYTHYLYRFPTTITVTAPAGTLHEAFFDPVTVGSAVAADSSNGVLKPTAFTDGNGASATLKRIAWEAGKVKLKLSPHTGLANHVLDFIVLDGKVSLSLDADDATVDVANNTLSWPVTHQPWKDGDKLMLRIHSGPVTIVPTPAAPTGLTATAGRGSVTLSWTNPSNSTIKR